MLSIEGLPTLSTDYPLTARQIEDYQSNGHVLLRAVCTKDEANTYAPIFRLAVAEGSKSLPALEDRDAYGKAFVQVMNLWREDERCKQFTLARRFAKIAAELMGAQAVRLYHDQALYKEPGGGHSPWHQDLTYWPLDTDNTVTMWMPLVDISQNMGTMDFASGSHKSGYLGDSHIQFETDERWEAFIAEHAFPVTNHGDMEAGDATFHTGLVLHDAVGNATGRLREVMTIIYFPDGTDILEPDNPYRQIDLETWIPGGTPGEPAASPLNPIVYVAEE